MSAHNRKPPACGAFCRPAIQLVNEPHSLCARRRKEKIRSFSSATCAAKKILLRLQVWNLCADGAQIMRAADCKTPCQKVILFDSISRRPAEHSAGRRPFFIRCHKTISSVPAPMSRQPIRDLGVKRSCRNTNASTSVMTTLSLSIGTTFDASPICSAR